jgi:hypothetical protein
VHALRELDHVGETAGLAAAPDQRRVVDFIEVGIHLAFIEPLHGSLGNDPGTSARAAAK